MAEKEQSKEETAKDEEKAGAQGEEQSKETWRVSGGKLKLVDDKDEDNNNDSSEGGAEKKPSLLDQTTSNQSTHDWMLKYFSRAMGISNEPPPESVLEEVTFEGIAKYIASEKCQKIVTMAGAGISTSAGIPDFRSPGTGLYDNLQKYDLPDPQAIFAIDFFKEKPEAFYTLAKELWPGSFKPTPCHYFLRLLDQKKKLLKHFTQNIDTLERVAGLDGDKIIEAHGTFHTAHCLECGDEFSQDMVKEKVFADTVPRCEKEECGGLVKPDIVFFGEALPKKFAQNVDAMQECDLLIILGTSLVVQPFASLTSRVKDNTPRLYINLEKTGDTSNAHPLTVLMFGGGFNFDGENNIRDVFWQGTCDDGCYALANLLGWGDELRKLVKDEHARIDKETAATGQKAQAKATPAKTTPAKTTPANTSKTSPVKPARNSTTKTPPGPANSKKVTPGKTNSKTDKKDKSSL